MTTVSYVGGGTDYNSGPFTATIMAGSDRTSFNVSITDDDIVEENEDFIVIIDMSSLPNDFILGSVSQATVVITDEDSKYDLIYTSVHT